MHNFRALQNVEFKNLQPMTVLLGPNGSGKSTVFDVFAFLAECFESGLRRAWDRRGRARELMTRGADGSLTIEIKYREQPKSPVLARFASDGTLKMLAYLVLLYDLEPPPFIGIEEPENFLHPRLLTGLAEECRAASERTQLLVTTHSPFFIDSLQPSEVRILGVTSRVTPKPGGPSTLLVSRNSLRRVPS